MTAEWSRPVSITMDSIVVFPFLVWRKFRIAFLMKIVFHAEENPDDKISYGELKDFFTGFLGKYHYSKIMQWLEEAGYQ